MSSIDDKEFESEVRRVARIRFGTEFGGAEVEDGRERDGVFETDDCIHVVEATVSRKQDKASTDAGKIEKLLKKYQSQTRHKAIRGWFVTREDPTADQRSVFRNPKYAHIEALSIHQFMAQIVDGKDYLNLREGHPFGSARDPKSDNTRLRGVALIEPRIVLNGKRQRLRELTRIIVATAGFRAMLIGDYGVGKSIAMREIFHELAKPYLKGDTLRFPVLLNLSDHQGQRDPVEALERHARSIGYAKPSHLVRAWRAGLVHILLDGFDEISTMVWGGAASNLKRRRHASMQLVRKLIEDSSAESSIVISGREHFFDSTTEMKVALTTSNWPVIHLAEFDSEQVAEYLKASSVSGAIPDWVPTRPLLLSYLVQRGHLGDLGQTDASAGKGWDMLLDRLAAREVRIEDGIDAPTMRVLLESVATKCRGTADGIGPVSHAEIAQIFEAVCGYKPTEESLTLIQRLPGLGLTNREDGARIFVDKDLASAASAGDMARYIADPYHQPAESLLHSSIGLDAIGIEVCIHKLDRDGVPIGALRGAFERARGLHRSSLLQLDLVRVASGVGALSSMPDSVTVSEVFLEHLDVSSEAGLAGLTVTDSIIAVLVLDRGMSDDDVPLFRNCMIGTVEGRFGQSDLPLGRFESCEIAEYGESNMTSSAILESRLPLTVRVLLVCLRKLYLQKGTGRKEGAFMRGVDYRARESVPAVLAMIEKHGFAVARKTRGDVVWAPVRNLRQRAAHIISRADDMDEPIVAEAWQS